MLKYFSIRLFGKKIVAISSEIHRKKRMVIYQPLSFTDISLTKKKKHAKHNLKCWNTFKLDYLEKNYVAISSEIHHKKSMTIYLPLSFTDILLTKNKKNIQSTT